MYARRASYPPSEIKGHIGESPAPCLKIWAQTTRVVWDQIAGLRVNLPRVVDIPSDVKMYTKYVLLSSEREGQVRGLLLFTSHTF